MVGDQGVSRTNLVGGGAGQGHHGPGQDSGFSRLELSQQHHQDALDRRHVLDGGVGVRWGDRDDIGDIAEPPERLALRQLKELQEIEGGGDVGGRRRMVNGLWGDDFRGLGLRPGLGRGMHDGGLQDRDLQDRGLQQDRGALQEIGGLLDRDLQDPRRPGVGGVAGGTGGSERGLQGRGLYFKALQLQHRHPEHEQQQQQQHDQHQLGDGGGIVDGLLSDLRDDGPLSQPQQQQHQKQQRSIFDPPPHEYH